MVTETKPEVRQGRGRRDASRLTPEQIEQIASYVEAGETREEIAQTLEMAPTTFDYRLQQSGWRIVTMARLVPIQIVGMADKNNTPLDPLSQCGSESMVGEAARATGNETKPA